MKQNKELIRFYIARFFNLLYFFIAVGVVYFEFRGFTLREAFMAMSFYSIMVVILEYPTGVIGDYFGHKASLLAATGVFVIVLFLLAFPWNMPVYYLLLGFLALGAALSSGSDVAMLHGLSKDFKRDYANYNIIIIVALFLASVIAGIVAKYSLPAVLLLSSLTGLIGGSILSTVKVKNIKTKEGNIFGIAKKGLYIVIKNSSLFLIVLFAGLVSEFQAGVKNVVVALATEPEYLKSYQELVSGN